MVMVIMVVFLFVILVVALSVLIVVIVVEALVLLVVFFCGIITVNAYSGSAIEVYGGVDSSSSSIGYIAGYNCGGWLH